jgi:hypothetical protein
LIPLKDASVDVKLIGHQAEAAVKKLNDTVACKGTGVKGGVLESG